MAASSLGAIGLDWTASKPSSSSLATPSVMASAVQATTAMSECPAPPAPMRLGRPGRSGRACGCRAGRGLSPQPTNGPRHARRPRPWSSSCAQGLQKRGRDLQIDGVSSSTTRVGRRVSPRRIPLALQGRGRAARCDGSFIETDTRHERQDAAARLREASRAPMHARAAPAHSVAAAAEGEGVLASARGPGEAPARLSADWPLPATRLHPVCNGDSALARRRLEHDTGRRPQGMRWTPWDAAGLTAPSGAAGDCPGRR